jgi:hypothetical protein
MPPKSKAKLKSAEQIAAEEAKDRDDYHNGFNKRGQGRCRHLIKELAKTAPKPTPSGGLKSSGGQKVALKNFEPSKKCVSLLCLILHRVF